MRTHSIVSAETQKVLLSVLPFFHIYGFNGILNPTMHQGMQMVSIPKFTPEDYISCIIKYKVMVKHALGFIQLQ